MTQAPGAFAHCTNRIVKFDSWWTKLSIILIPMVFHKLSYRVTPAGSILGIISPWLAFFPERLPDEKTDAVKVSKSKNFFNADNETK